MSTVAIVQRILPHYRVGFFRGLHDVLASDGIELRVLYGDHRPGAVPESVDIPDSWARKIENRYLDVLGAELVWQPAWRELGGAELVIIEQANRLLLTYPLILARYSIRRHTRLGLWGHGRNYQAGAGSVRSERLKRALVTCADWCFAYTDQSARDFASAGAPEDRITVVDNAIDTSSLAVALSALTAEELASLRTKLAIEEGAPVGLFCGGLHAGKELSFLIAACEAIRARVPSFHAVFLGDGPERAHILDACVRHSWVHHVGAVYGRERAAYFRIAEVLLMPAHLGLAIVDAFVAGTPVFATDRDNHSPELAYLRHGENGIMTPFSIDAYAGAVALYLEDDALQARLRAGCVASASRYTLENMIDRFATGIRACLAREAR